MSQLCAVQSIAFCAQRSFQTVAVQFDAISIYLSKSICVHSKQVHTCIVFTGPLIPRRDASWRADANVLNRQWWTANKGWSSRLGIGRETHSKKQYVTKCYTVHGVGGGSCEHGNRASVSITRREFLDQLNNYRLLNKDCAPYCGSVSNWECGLFLVKFNTSQREQLLSLGVLVFETLHFLARVSGPRSLQQTQKHKITHTPPLHCARQELPPRFQESCNRSQLWKIN
jgi:hypothetical protein